MRNETGTDGEKTSIRKNLAEYRKTAHRRLLVYDLLLRLGQMLIWEKHTHGHTLSVYVRK